MVAEVQSPSTAQQNVLNRVRSEYQEMPGLQLTLSQAGRLFGLEALLCDGVLGTLRDEGFLWRTSAGLFAMRAVRG
jgi:hypothetical protein